MSRSASRPASCPRPCASSPPSSHAPRPVLIFINQLREKVGIVFGNPETTPGGRALKFYSSVRIELRRAETLKDGTVVIGTRVKAKVVKNKVAPPFRTAEFDMMFTEAEHGISKSGCLLDLGIEAAPNSGADPIIRKLGTFYSFGDLRLGQGRERSKAFLRENPRHRRRDRRPDPRRTRPADDHRPLRRKLRRFADRQAAAARQEGPKRDSGAQRLNRLMVLITDLQRRAGVCTVSFESAPTLSCSREFAQRLKLGRGQDIDEIVLDRIRATAATDLAEYLAHKLLERPRSRRELAARLLQNGVPRQAALDVLERIEADGEHNDRR